jgi:hypothetical protein
MAKLHVVRVGEMRNEYQIMVEKSMEKELLGKPSHRWEGDVKMYLSEIVWEGAD